MARGRCAPDEGLAAASGAVGQGEVVESFDPAPAQAAELHPRPRRTSPILVSASPRPATQPLDGAGPGSGRSESSS